MRFTRHLLALAFLLGISSFATILSATQAAGLSVSVSITPAPDRPDDCLCKAEITDLADGKLIAAPNLLVRKGEAGKVTIGDQAKDWLVFDLSIDKTGAAASYSVTYHKKETVVAVQKGALSIR